MMASHRIPERLQACSVRRLMPAPSTGSATRCACSKNPAPGSTARPPAPRRPLPARSAARCTAPAAAAGTPGTRHGPVPARREHTLDWRMRNRTEWLCAILDSLAVANKPSAEDRHICREWIPSYVQSLMLNLACCVVAAKQADPHSDPPNGTSPWRATARRAPPRQ